MRALLIDDEPLARYELRRLLREHPEVELAGEAAEADEALRLIREQQPDLLFLDIRMPGRDGFELLEQIEGDVPHIIFTTAFDQHAIRAFEFSALDYLLKPIAPERLRRALSRVPNRTQRRLSQFFVRDGDRCWIVRLEEISLLESEGNYTRLHFRGERPLIRRTLQQLETQLGDAGFFRTSRQQVVNLAWVSGAEWGNEGSLILQLRSGAQVSVSRRRSEALRERLRL